METSRGRYRAVTLYLKRENFVNVVLVNPPALGLSDPDAYPPMGLMYLARVLIEKGHKVKIVDYAGISEAEAIKMAGEISADLVGITIISGGTFKICTKIAEKVKAPIVVAGGAFATSAAREVLDTDKFDAVVLGEGEKTIIELTNKPLSEVKGIACKVNGSIKFVKRQELLELDNLPFPARHLISKKKIQYKGGIHLFEGYSTTIFVSRGCPHNCSFCDTDMWQRKYRLRDPGKIAEEIIHLKTKYGITNIRFPDDAFTINNKWVTKVCDKLKKLDITWLALSTTDKVNRETLTMMKEAGCIGLFFGVESGSPRILKAMNKHATVDDNIRVIRLCKEVGITSSAYMMFGFPGENKESVEETKRFLLESKPDRSHFSTFIPLHGSDVWKNPQKYGIKIKKNYYDYWYYDNPKFSFEYDYISNKELKELRDDLTQFYIEQGYKTWNGK